jgi:hypothetical protein
MIARLLTATVWLLVGHAVLAGIYWTLLNVPESNVLMLGASATLGLVLLVGGAIVEGAAVRRLAGGVAARLTLGRSLGQSLGSVPAFVVALVIYAAFSIIAARLALWHETHAGEIDAWLIAHGDWTRTAWLHRGFTLALDFLRDVLGLSLATGAFAAMVLGGVGDLLGRSWIWRAWSPKRLIVVTAAVVGLIWWPWQAASWRPASLPPTFVQPLFAAVKLGLIAVVMHIGWAIVLWSATLRRTSPAPATPSEAPLPAAPPPPVETSVQSQPTA